MANENTNHVPQDAIPPKALPPSAAPAGDSQMSTSRTVRLNPVAPGTAPAAGRLPPVTPSAPAGTTEAANAIKRMTTRIAAVSGEIDPLTGNKITGPLPVESVSDTPASAHKGTARIPLSATARIPELADMPKTARGRVDAPSVLGASPAGKAKTSRIPLESAMNVSPTDAGIPKTIKLKRPDEMAVKVAAPGAEGADETTQKKTIRVKRPTAPEAAAEESASAPLSPLEMLPPTERGTGLFVALAVAVLLAVVGLVGLLSSQLYNWPVATSFDAQFQKG